MRLYPETFASGEGARQLRLLGADVASMGSRPPEPRPRRERWTTESKRACSSCIGSDQAEYRLGAASDEGRGLQAWLLHAGMVRLREMGVAVLNLGGGVRRGDGLFQFKAKFGGEQRDLHAVRQIYRPDVYRRLLDDAGVSPDETWFPPYRVRRLAADFLHESTAENS